MSDNVQIEDVSPDTRAAGEPIPQITEPRGGKKYRCAVTGKERAKKDLISFITLRPSIADRIRVDHPNISEDALIDRKVVGQYRRLIVEEILREEHGEFSDLDRAVTESIANQDTIAENVEDGFAERRTLGERLSDGLATFGGSWSFLISFAFILVCWVALNALIGEARAFDPYPFILLNLVLSCIAAVQAPIIMMSQKRQEAKDRMRSLNDYQVNLKAELEIRHLHEKLDHLISRQWARLAEIQQIQMEIMQDSRRK